MKDEVRMQPVRCTERNKSPSSDGMTELWGTRRHLACLAFYCCRHNITTSILGKKGSAHFTIYSPSSGETKQELEEDGNLESGAETETMKELCLHWLSLCLTQLTTTCPGTALSRAGWAVTSIINQENGAQTCLQANVVRVFSQLRFLFPDDTELCQYTERQTSAAPFLANAKFLNKAKRLVEGEWGG